jgi:hypothetical protein
MMTEILPQANRMIHVRFEGRSQDIAFARLDIGDLSSDQDIRNALARYFDVPERKFVAYVVERHTNGNMTVRPEAVFGIADCGFLRECQPAFRSERLTNMEVRFGEPGFDSPRGRDTASPTNSGSDLCRLMRALRKR